MGDDERWIKIERRRLRLLLVSERASAYDLRNIKYSFLIHLGGGVASSSVNYLIASCKKKHLFDARHAFTLIENDLETKNAYQGLVKFFSLVGG